MSAISKCRRTYSTNDPVFDTSDHCALQHVNDVLDYHAERNVAKAAAKAADPKHCLPQDDARSSWRLFFFFSRALVFIFSDGTLNQSTATDLRRNPMSCTTRKGEHEVMDDR